MCLHFCDTAAMSPSTKGATYRPFEMNRSFCSVIRQLYVTSGSVRYPLNASRMVTREGTHTNQMLGGTSIEDSRVYAKLCEAYKENDCTRSLFSTIHP